MTGTKGAQSGVVIMEFILSLVIVAGLTIVLFAMSYTLVALQVTQYVAFATARAYSMADANTEKQEQNARRKYEQLTTGNSAIASLYRGNFFKVPRPGDLEIRGGASSTSQNTFQTEFNASESDREWFQGVSIPFQAKLLSSIKLPLLGSTSPEDEDGQGFRTRVNGFLIREPSQAECQAFMRSRMSALQNLPSGQAFKAQIQKGYVPMEDNGC